MRSHKLRSVRLNLFTTFAKHLTLSQVFAKRTCQVLGFSHISKSKSAVSEVTAQARLSFAHCEAC